MMTSGRSRPVCGFVVAPLPPVTVESDAGSRVPYSVGDRFQGQPQPKGTGRLCPGSLLTFRLVDGPEATGTYLTDDGIARMEQIRWDKRASDLAYQTGSVCR